MTTTTLLPPDMPSRMRQLPRDSVGRPVPFFVEYVDGQPDFRIMNTANFIRAVREELCWICGQRLLRVRNTASPRGTFVAGPMCLINRTSAEPPGHADCAEWSAKACPFLSKPAKTRRETNLPTETVEAPGIAVTRNPGVTALIDSARWRVWRPSDHGMGGGKGVLFGFDRIENVRWMAHGIPANATEVVLSIDTGLHLLIEHADEPGGMRALACALRDALRWVDHGWDVRDFPVVASVLRELP